MSRLAVTAVLPAILVMTMATGAQTPAPRPLWTYETEQGVTSFGFSNTGHLVVTTASRSFLLGGEDGQERWTSTDLRDCRPDSEGDLRCRYLDRPAWSLHVPGSTFTRLYFDKRLVLLDLASGRATFDSAAHALGEVEGHYAVPDAGRVLLHSELEGAEQLLSGVRVDESGGFWRVRLPITKDFRWLGAPDEHTMLVYGKNADGQRVVTAVDLDAGAIAWTRTDLLTKDVPKRAVPRPFLDQDGRLVLFASKDGPMRLGAGGELLWRATALSGTDPQEIGPYGDRLIVYQDKKLSAVDLGTGAVLWQYDPRAVLYGVAGHPMGVLVWSQKNELQLVDRLTGKPRWGQPAAAPKGWSPVWWSLIVPYRSERQTMFVDDAQIIIAGRDELARISMVDGQSTTLAVFGFGDGEAPVRVERLEDDVLLLSNQNIARFTPNGHQLFHRYHPAPGVGTLTRLAQFAATVPYVESYGGFPVGSGRINSSRMTERFLYMYFEDKGGEEARRFGLVRIDKSTGEESPALWINERFPEWVLDYRAERVVYKTGPTSLHAVQYSPQ